MRQKYPFRPRCLRSVAKIGPISFPKKLNSGGSATMRNFIFYLPLDNISGDMSMLVLGLALIGTVNAALHNVNFANLDMNICKAI